jgi:acyl carrier protein
VPAADIEGEVVTPRSREEIEAFLLQKLARALSIAPHDVDVRQPFSALGLDSLRALTLVDDIETWLGHPVSPTVFWNYPTLAALTEHLAVAAPQLAAEVDART